LSSFFPFFRDNRQLPSRFSAAGLAPRVTALALQVGPALEMPKRDCRPSSHSGNPLRFPPGVSPRKRARLPDPRCSTDRCLGHDPSSRPEGCTTTRRRPHCRPWPARGLGTSVTRSSSNDDLTRCDSSSSLELADLRHAHQRTSGDEPIDFLRGRATLSSRMRRPELSSALHRLPLVESV